MSNIIQGHGATLILDTSSTGAGSWYQNQAGMTNLTFQLVCYGTSAASTAGATVSIEVSNDGVNACATVLGTITLSSANGVSDGFATASNWRYYRAKCTSVTAATAGAAGTTVAEKVYVSGQSIL
jgi:hypothetical protein